MEVISSRKWPAEANKDSFTRGHTQPVAAPVSGGADKQKAFV